MKKSLQILFMLSFILTGTLFPQLKYKMTPGSGTYTPIASGQAFTWTGTSLDGNITTATAIGFPFTYDGVTFDSLQVSTDGFIRLGTDRTATTSANALRGTLRQIIAPLWDDLAVADSLNNIVYSLEGSAPNRVFKVEWKAMKWSFSSAVPNAVFSAELHENGNIVFKYGAFGTVLSTFSASIGLNGTLPVTTANQATGHHLSINLTGDAGSRATHQTMGSEFTGVSLAPDNGQTFTFTPHTPVPMAGTYTVGGATPSFATLSEAAMALNLNGINGDITLNIRPGTYDDVFHLLYINGQSSGNPIMIKPESGEVILQPKYGSASTTAPSSTLGDAIIRLDGSQYVTIDGLKLIADATMATAIHKYEMGIFLGNAIVNTTAGITTWGARFNVVKNVSIDMNAFGALATGGAGSIGIRMGTTGTSITDTSAANSYNTFQDITIEDFWRAAFFTYGFSGLNPDRGNKVTAVTGRNAFKNVNITAGGSDVRAVEAYCQFDFLVEKTDIHDLIVTSTGWTTNVLSGFRYNPANSSTDFNSGNLVIRDVNIWNLELQQTQATSAGVVGMELLRIGANSSYTISNVSVSDLYTNGSTTSLARGIAINAGAGTGATTNAYIYNNLVYDIRAPRSTGTPGIRAYDIQNSPGGTLNTYMSYNTVLLDNAVPPTAATNQSSGIYWGNYGTSVLELKNNIVINNMASTLRAAALYATSNANLLRLSAASNNNLYYGGTPAANALIAWDGATGYQTIEAYKTAVATGGPREVLSVTEMPPFVSAVSPYNLNMQTTVGTQAESGGQPVAGITTDYAGTARNADFPDIGAYEFAGIAIDNNPPLISYTNLSNTHFTSNRTLTATITDPSGLGTGLQGIPRLYFKKSVNDTYISTTASGVNGDEFTFTIRPDFLPGGSVAPGDTIFYYVAAQDANGIAGTNPAGGSGATPPGTTPPAAPRSYLINGAPLNGVYTISAPVFNRLLGKNIESRTFERIVAGPAPFAQLEADLTDKDGNPIEQVLDETHVQQYEVLYEGNAPYRGSRSLNQTVVENAKAQGLLEANIESVYPSLAAAVTDLNLRGVSGHVTFLLADTLYTTATLQILIGYDSVTNANRTVTFKPASGVNTRITANSTSPAFVVVNDYVTIDGSNTVGGTTRNMIIENTNAGASAGVAFFQAAYGTIKNVTGFALNPTAGYGIVFNAALNGVIENNDIRRTTLGIQLQGWSNGSVVKNNFIGAADTLDMIQNIGIAALSTRNFEIKDNYISGLRRAATSSTAGIVLGVTATGDSLMDGSVYNNYIKNVKHTGIGTAAYGAYGIRLAGTTAITSSNLKIYNNVITDILGDGDAGVGFNPVGIFMSQGAGYQIYFNSINMYGAINYAGASAAGSAAILVNGVSVTNLDIRNNVLRNSQTFVGTLGKTYAFYSVGANTTFADINSNDYWSVGEDSAFNYLGGTAYADLAAWQAATGKDANSKAVNPNYTDTLNLRPLAGSGVYFAGQTIPGITTDFDGDTRTATPSMGAYEFPVGVTIGWANLQWPPAATINVGGSNTVYGQIWVDGVTTPPGQAPGISAWVGYNTTNDDPSGWTNWVPATYNVDAGNNDEYMASIGMNLAPGTYYYAYRYQLYGGAYYYGGYSTNGGGQWNGTTNVSGTLTVQPPLVINWERSAANTTLPGWFSPTGSTERGFAWGRVMLPNNTLAGRVIVPSRNAGTYMKVLDDSTGADIGDLDINGISGGTFTVNDAEVDYLGHIFAANLVTDASASAFKVYRWKNTGAAPEVAISYIGDAVRLGDKFSVEFDSASNATAVWAASATTGQPKVYKWTKIAGLDSFNQVPTVITLSDAISTGINSAAVGPLYNGSFYWNAGGQSARKYSANGTLIGIVPGTIVATGSNAIKFVGTQNGSEFFATFQFGAGNNNVRVVEVPNGDPTLALTYGVSPSLGANSNGNGTGDVAVKRNADGSSTIFVMATNNGIGSYRTTRNIPVEFTAFTAKSQDRDVVLTWTTATETNSASFLVERTVLGSANWSAVGSVRAAGTTTDEQTYTFVDRNLNTAKYQYRLKQIDLDGTFQYSSVVEVEVGLPMTFGLSQNYPNPFNPTTKIQYQVPADARVTLELFDVTGQRVASLVNAELTAGYYAFDLSAGSYGLASGIYFYRMTAVEMGSGKNFVETKKMVMLK
ncbi:MAG: T9SS type A sorting domain-containing protein [Ignavibacteriales bacterium]|nr:MAG: T9SS type A sorting domain-containing protein [Ignavibacteriales bacterium]